MTRTLVIVGHGMVGHRLVEALREKDVTDQWRVVVFAEESRPAYDRVALSSYVDSWDAGSLSLAPHDDDAVELHLNDQVVHIDRDARVVRTTSGRVQSYDALVLATGSVPFVPPVPGRDLPGCHVYRTIEDLDGIRATVEAAHSSGRHAGMVLGGGLLGLEAANALRGMGISPHVVELGPRLMPLQVDEGGGGLLKRLVEKLDLTVHTGTSASSIEQDRGRLIAKLSNGVELDLDVVVFSAGIRPRDELAREFGLTVGERGGIIVDQACRTSDEHIYAIGECANLDGMVYGGRAGGRRQRRRGRHLRQGRGVRRREDPARRHPGR
jgi:nitrite reductase (NADH) large subunit